MIVLGGFSLPAAARLLRVVACVGVLCVGVPSATVSARGGFSFCNKTKEDISVAIAYYSGDADFFVSEGWWNLKPGKCASLFPDNSFDVHRYYYAESASWKWVSAGGPNVCIDPQHRFRIAHADSLSPCSSPYVRQQFHLFGDRDVDLAP